MTANNFIYQSEQTAKKSPHNQDVVTLKLSWTNIPGKYKSDNCDLPPKIIIFVSPERSSERDYVITDSVCSMCM